MPTITHSKVFNVYPDTENTVQAVATFNEEFEIIGVKLLTKVPRGMYYSFLNDALIEAGNLCINS